MNERLRFSKKGWAFVLAVILLLPAAGYYGLKAWRYYATHVSTDNAYVQADVAQITPRIAGTVVELTIEENWWVQAGQVLVRLDARDAEVRLAQAQAALARAHETVDQLFAAVAVADERKAATRAQVAAAQAEIAGAQADFRQAELDLQRANALVAEQVIAAQQFDRAQTQYDTALARLHTKQQQFEQAKKAEATQDKELEHARAALGAATTAERVAHSLIQQAEAVVREAGLNLSYCTLVAPIEGMVSKKAVEAGQRVQPGQPLMAIVPLQRVYIEANYKETQLTHVRVGQAADIMADLYPGHVYKGKVESLSGGTGSAFSLLPPENATGNWVKVVQRLPVKILLDEPPSADKPLRMGLSVEVTIDTSHRQGPLVHSLRQEEAQARAFLSAAGSRVPASLPMPSPTSHGGQ